MTKFNNIFISSILHEYNSVFNPQISLELRHSAARNSHIYTLFNSGSLNGSSALHMFATEIVVSIPYKWAQWMTLLSESYENERRRLYATEGERNGDAFVFACVCAVLRKIHWADGPTVQRASYCGSPRWLLRLPVESRPVLVSCLGCGGGANGAQSNPTTIDVSLSSLGIYFSSSTGISNTMPNC